MSQPKRNGHGVVQYFLTFPQSGSVTKQQFAEAMPPNEYVLVHEERHEDGNPHLHMSIKLCHKKTKPKFIDWLTRVFPMDFHRIKVEPTRSVERVENYNGKEDPFPYKKGEIKRHKKIRSPEAIERDFRNGQLVWTPIPINDIYLPVHVPMSEQERKECKIRIDDEVRRRNVPKPWYQLDEGFRKTSAVVH